MDVLLGLIPPLPYDNDQIDESTLACNSTIPKNTDENRSLIEDINLNNAVSDFEKTLQRSKHCTVHNNLPDVTAVSGKSHLF